MVRRHICGVKNERDGLRRPISGSLKGFKIASGRFAALTLKVVADFLTLTQHAQAREFHCRLMDKDVL